MSKCADSMCQAQTQEDKHYCENHNPEPREPEAREWVTALEKKYGNCCGDVIHLFAEDLEREVTRYSAELRAERDRIQKQLDDALREISTSATWEDYFEKRARAAERSLLQARADLKKYGRHLHNCEEGKQIMLGSSDWRNGRCTCGFLASTSAPKGDLSK